MLLSSLPQNSWSVGAFVKQINKHLAELVGLDEGDYGQKLIEVSLSPTQQLVMDFLAVTQKAGLDVGALVSTPTALDSFANGLQRLLAGLSQFNDPKGAYSHCFCEID